LELAFGYSAFMICYRIKNKQNIKLVWIYILPIILTICAFLGIYIKYQNQELGNLEFENNYKINMKNINIENTLEFSSKKQNKLIYQKAALTKEQTRELAESIFAKLGEEIDESRTDYYEQTAIYYTKNYSIWVEYKDGTYLYTDFTKFSNDIKEKQEATQEEIEKALEKLEIEIPETAEFEERQEGCHGYMVRVDMDVEEDSIINGKLSCTYYEDGTIKELQNNIVKYDKVKEMEIKSEEEAYNEILEGKFRYSDKYIGKIENLEMKDIKLEYALDTKGYYVPIYTFKVVINGQQQTISIKAVK